MGAPQAATRDFDIRPLGPHTGAEVVGLDLRKPVDAAAKAAIEAALIDYCCLVFPEQHFTPEEYAEAAGLFGAVQKQNFSKYALPDLPTVNAVSNAHPGADGQRAYHASYWHTDFPNFERPPDYTILYAVTMPEEGGETGVANMRAAFEALPEDRRAHLAGLKAFTVRRAGAVDQSRMKTLADEDPEFLKKSVIQPLVRTHPVTGTKALYFHKGKVEYLLGMAPKESRDLLEDLIETAIRPEFVYKHKWRVGDMLVIDNRATMHRGYPNYDLNQDRLLYRIIVGADEAF
jgi:taurine dioxygenase